VVVFRARLTVADGAGPENTFVVLLPDNAPDPLILGTKLAFATVQEARAVIRVYEKRWLIETSFDTMKGAFGLEKFTVRKWQAIDRLLNLVALAFTVSTLLMNSSQKNVQRLLSQAVHVFNRWAGFKTLTLRKLREPMALDFDQNR
jgi:hypothetical protein